MNRDKKSPRGKKRNLKEVQKVHDLYRQADQKYGGFAEPDQMKLNAVNPAVSSSVVAHAEDQGDQITPTWILDVLEDLISFCRQHDHFEIESPLQTAKRTIAKKLANMGNGSTES